MPAGTKRKIRNVLMKGPTSATQSGYRLARMVETSPRRQSHHRIRPLKRNIHDTLIYNSKRLLLGFTPGTFEHRRHYAICRRLLGNLTFPILLLGVSLQAKATKSVDWRFCFYMSSFVSFESQWLHNLSCWNLKHA